MVAPVVRDFLNHCHARFYETAHPRVATALAEANKDHTPASELAKTVLIRANGQYLLAVLPANTRIYWPALVRVLGTTELRLAAEDEIAALFPELEVGAIPPLGPLFDMPVFIDARLASHDAIAFNAGSHTNTIHMPFGQFRRLVEPRVCSFAVADI